MDDAFLMRGLQCFGDLAGNPPGLGERQSFPRQAVLEGLAAAILHGDEELSLRFADLVGLADVRMVQGGYRLRFPEKAFLRGFALLQRLSEEFQGDTAVEGLVTGEEDSPIPPSPIFSRSW